MPVSSGHAFPSLFSHVASSAVQFSATVFMHCIQQYLGQLTKQIRKGKERKGKEGGGERGKVNKGEKGREEREKGEERREEERRGEQGGKP